MDRLPSMLFCRARDAQLPASCPPRDRPPTSFESFLVFLVRPLRRFAHFRPSVIFRRPAFRASLRTRWRGGSRRARASGAVGQAGGDRRPCLILRRPLLGGADRRRHPCRPRCPDERPRCPDGRELVLRRFLERWVVVYKVNVFSSFFFLVCWFCDCRCEFDALKWHPALKGIKV